MKGPISVTRITDEPVERHDYELVIKTRLRTYKEGPLDCEAFAFMLNSVLDDWMDGRRPFEVEEIHDGLFRCLKRAAYEVVCKRMQDKFGNEMVGDEMSSTARWLIEAQKEKPVVPDFDGLKVEVTEK